MRPEQLYPLFASVATLKGVGAKLQEKLTNLAGKTIWDILCHFPRTALNRILVENLTSAHHYDGQEVLIKAVPIQHIAPPKRGMPYRIIMMDSDNDASTRLELIFFNIKQEYLNRTLPLNQPILLAGRVDIYRQKLQMVHPHIMHLKPDEAIPTTLSLEPIYPLTTGLSRLMFRKIMETALTHLPKFPEWLDEETLEKYQLPSFYDALHQIHQPKQPDDILPQSPAHTRLALDELYANQLMLGLMKKYGYKQTKNRNNHDDNLALCQKIIADLPFTLTPSQQKTFDEIKESLHAPTRMLRLLQGDVGSGKTILALLAMVLASGIEGQSALMAPTDILAKQHYHNFRILLEKHNIEIILLTGKMKSTEKKAALERINHYTIDKSPQMVIGTHALFQEQVRYHDLRLAVIDEQHRFGVHQRLIFSEKAKNLDMMVMSATPIPRTLMLSHWHNLEVSRLTELPKGRKPIVTRLFSQSRMAEIIDAITRAIAEGRKIYWVCPLIEQNDEDENPQKQKKNDVTSRATMLQNYFSPELIEQLHGKMPATQKDKALHNFSDGKAQILVATTVIEVGVDIKEASIMVIEHAEQFGLAALHQLRGRIGRGETDSYCLLIHDEILSANGQERLKTIRHHHDGFAIAEMDLKLRGGGDMLGIRQSGLPDFRFVDWVAHHHLIDIAQIMADKALENDLVNNDKNNRKNIALLLYLFEHDNAVRLLQSA